MLRWWEGQRAMARAIFEHDAVILVGSRGVGKSHMLRAAIGAFFLTRPSRVIVTATGERQVRLLMDGANVALARSNLDRSRLTKNQLRIAIDPLHYIIGFSAANPDAARGFHADPQVPLDPDADALSEEDLEFFASYVGEDAASDLLLVIDEASGVDPRIFHVLEGMKNKPNVKIVYSLNATLGVDDDHPVLRALRTESGFYRIKIASIPESVIPDTTGIEYDEVYDDPPDYLVSRKERERAIALATSGTDRALQVNWLAQFATGSTESRVVPRAVLEEALFRYEENLDRLAIGPRIGIDLGFVHDDCVAVLMHDGIVQDMLRWRPPSDSRQAQVEVATRIAELCVAWGRDIGRFYPADWDGQPIVGSRLSIDATGLPGVADILYSDGIESERVNFGAGDTHDWPHLSRNTKCLNTRTRMYLNARRGLNEGFFCVPRIDRFRDLWEELPWTLYKVKARGNDGLIWQLEPKEDVIERHGRSPDAADAFALACRSGGTGIVLGSFGGPRVSTFIPGRAAPILPGMVARAGGRIRRPGPGFSPLR